jgi:hypothetical protein
VQHQQRTPAVLSGNKTMNKWFWHSHRYSPPARFG